MDTINIKYAKTIFVLSLVSVVAFFVSKTLASLSLENGWIIGPHMAFAERLKSGILAYCNGVDDIFFPSSPYFPGAAFLSYFYSLVGLDSGLANTTALLLTSIAIGIALFIAMYCFIRRIYPQIPPVLVFAFLSIFSFLQVRSFYSAGILWFKSDGILLLCGFLSMLLFTKHSKPTLKNLILIGILLFIASFFKQSACFIFLLVYLIVAFSKNLILKQKILILASYTLVGLIACAIMFSIDNLFYLTISSMSKHGFAQTSEFIKSLLSIMAVQNTFFIPLAIFGVFLTLRESKLLSDIKFQYLIFSIIWFAYNTLLNAAKLGGEDINMNTGVIAFMPFVIYAAYNIYQKRFYKSILSIGIILALCFLSAYSVRNIAKYANKYSQYLQDYKQEKAFITKHFANKKAFITSDLIKIGIDAKLDMITGYDPLWHYELAGKNMSNLNNALKNQVYDVVFRIDWLDRDDGMKWMREDIYRFYEFYENSYESSDLPQSLQHKVLVRKVLQD